VDPCPSPLEPPRDSSPLVDPCSSRQETGCQETRAGSARGTPGLEGLESSRLVHNTTVTLLDNSLSQRTDVLAEQFETDASDALDWSPAGTYRASGTLGNTVYKRVLIVQSLRRASISGVPNS